MGRDHSDRSPVSSWERGYGGDRVVKNQDQRMETTVSEGSTVYQKMRGSSVFM